MGNESIDLQEVLERVQEDRELLLELFQIFEEDFNARRAKLQELIKSGDAGAVRDLTHSMKGAAGNISAKAIHETCSRMEQLSGSGDLKGVQALIAGLDEQFQQALEFINKFRKEAH